LDENEAYVNKLFPKNGERLSFVFIDKTGKRRNIRLERIEDLSAVVSKLVKE